MFRRIDEDAAASGGVFSFEGETVAFREGDSVAAALLGAGHVRFRASPVDGTPRGPYCMMGVCFECLVEIDGNANRQACLTPARNGMVVSRQIGPRTLK